MCILRWELILMIWISFIIGFFMAWIFRVTVEKS